MENKSPFSGKIMLAPMAGVGDFAFRTVCKEQGAQWVTSEMISAKALCYGDKKTPLLARITDFEQPMSLQLFGADPRFMAQAVTVLLDNAAKNGSMPAAIDVNMGCPVPKVVNNGEGSALMKNLPLAEQILKAVVAASSVPVTVKMRLGWDQAHKNAAELAKIAEQAGVCAVCVHARTRSMMYTPGVLREGIAEVKRAVSVPVIGNGDLFTKEDVDAMFSETGCDSVAIARGALGNPFLFAEVIAAREGKPYTPPTVKERIATALKQLALAVEDKGEYTGLAESRKHLAYYTKGIPGSAAIRGKINEITSPDEMKNLLLSFAEEAEQRGEAQ